MTFKNIPNSSITNQPLKNRLPLHNLKSNLPYDEFFFHSKLSMQSGYGHTCFITSNLGKLVCWGYNNNNQTQVPPLLFDSHTYTLAVGYQHTCAGRHDIDSQHTLNIINKFEFMCWGKNDRGQCDTHNIPIKIPNLTIGTAAAGFNSTCASNLSTIVCIGDDTFLQSTPAKMGEQIASLACGALHSCVIGRKHKFKCWGKNDMGQTDPPKSVVAVRQIALGNNHSCALSDKFRLDCWGSNRVLQLDIVKQFVNKNMKLNELSVIMNSTCVVDNTYKIWCKDVIGTVQFEDKNKFSRMISVSDNAVCQIKLNIDGTYPGITIICQNLAEEEKQEFVNEINELMQNGLFDSGIRSLTLGETNSCILYNNDINPAQCYGKNRKKNNNIPNEYQNKIKYLSTNYNHTCAVLQQYDQELISNKTQCWGENQKGQCDTKDIDIEKYNINFVRTGLEFTCHMVIHLFKSIKYNFKKSENHISNNFSDQIVNNLINNTSENQISNNFSDQIDNNLIDNTSEHQTYNLTSSSSVKEDNYNSTETDNLIVLIDKLTTETSSSNQDSNELNKFPKPTIMIERLNEIICWGDNSHKQQDIPTNIIKNPTQFDLGSGHVCLLTQLSDIICWGANKAGQATPPAATTQFYWTKVNAGFQHNCGINYQSYVMCWGWHTGTNGVLTPPKNLKAADMAVGQAHNCIVHTFEGRKELKCWGRNEYLQLHVPPGVGMRTLQLLCGYQHCCVVLHDAQISCWGRNDKGQAQGVYWQQGEGRYG